MKKDMTEIVAKAMRKLDSMTDGEVLAFFNQHKDGGIFTEMLSHGLLPSFLDASTHYSFVGGDYRQFISDIAGGTSFRITTKDVMVDVVSANDTPFMLAA